MSVVLGQAVEVIEAVVGQKAEVVAGVEVVREVGKRRRRRKRRRAGRGLEAVDPRVVVVVGVGAAGRTRRRKRRRVGRGLVVVVQTVAIEVGVEAVGRKRKRRKGIKRRRRGEVRVDQSHGQEAVVEAIAGIETRNKRRRRKRRRRGKAGD